MTTHELKEQIKPCHPDVCGHYRLVNRMHDLLASLHSRCQFCGGPLPIESPRKHARRKFCSQLCDLKRRSARRGGLIAASLLLCASLHAGTVTLTFTPSPTEGVTNYVLVAKQGTNTVRANLGLSYTNTVNYTNDAKFTVLAEKEGAFSDPSNELSIALVQPSGNLTVTVEQSANITSTNWQTVGFFRLKIGP